jgi:hypothetical protein
MSIIRKVFKLALATALTVTIFGGNIALSAEPKAVRKYPIPEYGTLELNVPASWKDKAHKPQEKIPPTIIFNPATGDDFQITVTVMWSKKGEKGFNSPDKVRAMIEKDGQKLLSKTVETKIALQEIKGASSTGYYFFITDKAPEPGEYRYMTRGGIGVGNLLLSATILHRVKDSESVKEALSMLREARRVLK